MPKLKDTQHVYVKTMGKFLKITGIFPDDDSTNAWLKNNPGHGVVASFGDIAVVAWLHDMGEKQPY
jgi:hypothetical protein